MWRSIVEDLTERGCLGPALSIACGRHTDKVNAISNPGELPRISPDGKLIHSWNHERL